MVEGQAKVTLKAISAGGREQQKGSEVVVKEDGVREEEEGGVPREDRKGNSSGRDGSDLNEPHPNHGA